ncbi:glycosyltransferase family 4 protein [Pseudoalteromonas sp. SIMBA_148]
MFRFNKTLLLSHEQPPMLGGAGVIAETIYNSLKLSGLIDINKPASYFRFGTARFIGVYYVIKALFYKNVILNDLYYKKLWLFFFRSFFSSKCIIYLHGSEPEFLLGESKYSDLFIKTCIKSKKIVAVSNFMKEKFLNELSDENKRKLKNKIVVIKNGVDTNVFNGKDMSKPRNCLIIVSASRLVFGKGYLELADEIKKISLSYSKPLRWYIAGEGPDEIAIREYVSSIGISEITTFTGKLDKGSLAKLYKKAHFFILLSKLKESLGLVYMEASCCGCLSIGFSSFGVKEAIIDGETGLFINNTSKLVELVNSQSINLDPLGISETSINIFSKENMINKINHLLFAE